MENPQAVMISPSRHFQRSLFKPSRWLASQNANSHLKKKNPIPGAKGDQILETLRSRFFGISPEPRTSRSHVTSALPSGFRFSVHVCTSRPRAREVSDLPQVFLHPKTSQSHVWEEILLFRTISRINYRILFHRNVILKTISQLK